MNYTFQSQPRISGAQFNRVLVRYQSPCAPIADECYGIITQAGLDPAVALAFFGHESVFGTRGIASETKNWGNVRAPYKPERASGRHPRNFAIYPTWQDGLIDWCDRINERYVRERGLDTVEKAVPVYAPTSDGNVPQAYIEHVNRLIGDWMAEDQGAQPAPPSPTTPGVPSDQELRDALLSATFAATGATYNPANPIHAYMVNETGAGRPLGNPIGQGGRITVGGVEYVFQVFALDTLFSPVQHPDRVLRMSELLR
jgi:hypothetical protein